MASATDALELLIGNHLLRTASWPKPTVIYIALFTVLPDEDGTGGTEVAGGNYARVLRGPLDADWTPPVSGDGVFSNAAAVLFAVPNADWGLVVGAGLYDASTGGVLQTKGALDTNRDIFSGDPAPNFPIGAFKFTFS